MSQESTTTTETVVPAQGQEGIQPGLADRAEAIKGIAQTRENLGQVAAGLEVHVAPNGVVLTDKEHKDVLARRAA